MAMLRRGAWYSWRVLFLVHCTREYQARSGGVSRGHRQVSAIHHHLGTERNACPQEVLRGAKDCGPSSRCGAGCDPDPVSKSHFTLGRIGAGRGVVVTVGAAVPICGTQETQSEPDSVGGHQDSAHCRIATDWVRSDHARRVWDSRALEVTAAKYSNTAEQTAQAIDDNRFMHGTELHGHQGRQEGRVPPLARRCHSGDRWPKVSLTTTQRSQPFRPVHGPGRGVHAEGYAQSAATFGTHHGRYPR
jgi:hypothetical protein